MNDICTQKRQLIHAFDIIYISAYSFRFGQHSHDHSSLASLDFFLPAPGRSNREMMCSLMSFHVPYCCEILFSTYIAFLKARDNMMSHTSLIMSWRSTVTDFNCDKFPIIMLMKNIWLTNLSLFWLWIVFICLLKSLLEANFLEHSSHFWNWYNH